MSSHKINTILGGVLTCASVLAKLAPNKNEVYTILFIITVF